jgi:hypothetical protein
MITMQRIPTLECGLYKPTHNDIWQACKQIQATWSPRERAQRDTGPRVGWWIPPSIRLSIFVEAIMN